MFTEKEVAYLKSQPLARVATVSPDGQPTRCRWASNLTGSTFTLAGAIQAKRASTSTCGPAILKLP